MSRFASADGLPRIFVGAGPIASMENPDLSEINAMTDLSAFLTKDGFSTGETGNTAPAASASQKYNLEVSGSINLQVSMTFFRDDATDTAWSAFERGDEVYVVFARKGGSGTNGAIAAGDEVEVYFGEILDKSNADIAENTTARFTSRLSTGKIPEMSAVVTDDSSSSSSP